MGTDTHQRAGTRRQRPGSDKARPASANAVGTVSPLGCLGHEIRTPMTAMLCATELLLQGPLADEQRHLLGSLQRSAQSLLLLAEHALAEAASAHQVANAASRRPCQLFCPRQLAADVVALMSSSAQRKKLRLCSAIGGDVPVALQGDALGLRQILGNLLSNAIKFTEGGEITLRLDWRAGEEQHAEVWPRKSQRPARLQIEVQDSGVGMNAAALSRLFQPFFSTPGTRGAKEAGTGLGLVITQQLVRQLGGCLQVHSLPGQGTRFSASLVFDEVTSMAARVQAALPGPLPCPQASMAWVGRVLVVDDDPVLRELIQLMLQRLGLEAVCAEDGDAALALLRQSSPPFDLVLMDCQMPGLDGAEVLRIWRAEQAGRHCPPILAMSGSQPGLVQQSGFDDGLDKPFTPATLERKLQRWLLPSPAATRCD